MPRKVVLFMMANMRPMYDMRRYRHIEAGRYDFEYYLSIVKVWPIR